jgi:uncharacterized membrane protein YkvA (DUF1232 family)
MACPATDEISTYCREWRKEISARLPPCAHFSPLLTNADYRARINFPATMKKNMSDQYSESGFWEKLKNFAKAAGKEVIQKALWLYYAAQRPDTPVWAKTAIYGALAYFVMPFDAVPDVLPLVGYTDDLGVLASALAAVTLYINDDVKREADAQMATWFD